MEQIHKKIEEYHRLEALRHPTNNATITTSANATSNSTTVVEEAVATRGLLRKVDPARPSGTGKEHKLQEQDHVELGRTVRALRAAAIAQAQKDGTWHVNPALASSSKKALKTAVHKHKSKDDGNVRGNVGGSVEENHNKQNSRTIGQAKESVWWKWW